MKRDPLISSLTRYREGPLITQEEYGMFDELLKFVKSSPDCFERTHSGHVTDSAWVVSQDFSKALLTHHRKLGSWYQLGGHADGDPDIPAVALKEAQEESGIDALQLVSPEIYDIDIHPIPGPCRAHYDIRYLIKAPEGAQYTVTEESLDLAWVPIDSVDSYTKKRSVVRLAEKMRRL